MHAGFAQSAAFDQDAIVIMDFLAQSRLAIPVLALGGAKSFVLAIAVVMRFAADEVTGTGVPEPGRWIMEENPRADGAAYAWVFGGGWPRK